MFERVVKKEIANRKEMVIFFLEYLNDRNKPATFSDFFFECFPSGGADQFESVMSEMIANKWVIKNDNFRRVEGTHLMSNNAKYSISLLGVEYLNSVGLIDDKYQRIEEKPPSIVNNYGNLVLGNDNKYVKQLMNDMTNNNNNSISGNNNTAIQNTGDNAQLNLTQNIGNTFSQENKNDIKEIIQFLKENKKELNLPNHTNTDIQILEDEINNETPNKGRINFALDSIKSGLISVGANLATPKVQEGLAMVVEIIKGAA